MADPVTLLVDRIGQHYDEYERYLAAGDEASAFWILRAVGEMIKLFRSLVDAGLLRLSGTQSNQLKRIEERIEGYYANPDQR